MTKDAWPFRQLSIAGRMPTALFCAPLLRGLKLWLRVGPLDFPPERLRSSLDRRHAGDSGRLLPEGSSCRVLLPGALPIRFPVCPVHRGDVSVRWQDRESRGGSWRVPLVCGCRCMCRRFLVCVAGPCERRDSTRASARHTRGCGEYRPACSSDGLGLCGVSTRLGYMRVGAYASDWSSFRRASTRSELGAWCSSPRPSQR